MQRYTVDGRRTRSCTRRAAGTVVVDGDGFAFAPLTAAGVLPTQPTVRLAGDLSPAELPSLPDRTTGSC